MFLLLTLWFPTGPMASAFALVGASPSGHALSVGWLHGRAVLVMHHADHDADHETTGPHDHHRLVDRLLLLSFPDDHGDEADHAVSLSDADRLSRPERSLQLGHDVLPVHISPIHVDLRATGVALAPTPGPAPPPPRRTTPLQI